MATFVIVHGGFGGGWEWTPVARLLREQGHECFTPTLTGMGERAHLAGPDVDLSTHVADVLGVLESEDARDVILCGASYGGMPVTAAADRAAGRVRLVVYVDALVPRDGQSALDILPASFADEVRRAGERRADGWWRIRIPEAALPPAGRVPEEQWAHYVARLCDQPAKTFLEPIRLSGAVDRLPRAFVSCTAREFGDRLDDPISPMAARARAEGWEYRVLDAPHDPHLADPEGVAALLHELAGEPDAL